MTIRDFNNEFGIGLIQLCEDKILAISKDSDISTYYTLDVDTSNILVDTDTTGWLEFIVTDDELVAIDTVSTQNTEIVASVSLDTLVILRAD